jgi:hypothetical protein
MSIKAAAIDNFISFSIASQKNDPLLHSFKDKHALIFTVGFVVSTLTKPHALPETKR